MIVTKNKEIAERCKIMRLHGISRDAFDRYTSTKPAWFYEVVEPGFKYNMTDLAASLGIHQLKKVHFFQRKRSEMANKYDQAFAQLPLRLPSKSQNGDLHSWHLYVIQLLDNAKISREVFIEKMAENGIGCSVHFIPLHIQPYWKRSYNLHPEDYPEALNVYNKTVSLPIYTKMSVEDQEKVITTVKKILNT